MLRRNLLVLFALLLLAAAAVAIMKAQRSFRDRRDTVSSAPIGSASGHATSDASPKRSWPTIFSVELRGLPPKEDLPPDTLRVLVLGDSVAKFLGLAMRYRQDEKQAFVAERGVGSCSIFETKPYLENGKQLMSSSCSMTWAQDVAELRPDVTFIVMGGGFFSDGACTKTFQVDYEKRFFELTGAMGTNAGRIVVARVPYPIKAWRHSNVMERVDCFNNMLVDIAQKGQWNMVDLMDHVCPTHACNAESEGKPIRPDGLHFDGGGAEETARWTLGELWRIQKHTTNGSNTPLPNTP